jgi:hypothetical protein
VEVIDRHGAVQGAGEDSDCGGGSASGEQDKSSDGESVRGPRATVWGRTEVSQEREGAGRRPTDRERSS